MSFSRDLARRRALLHAAALLDSALAVGHESLFGYNDDIGIDGCNGMTDDEACIQVAAVRDLIAELERRAGITTHRLNRTRRGALAAGAAERSGR